jgi:predicted ABC-type ATPase
VLADAEGGNKNLKAGMPVLQADMPVRQLLGAASDFSARKGLSSRQPGEFSNPQFARPPAPKAPLPADSKAMHAPGGTYTPERAALHASIVKEMLDGHKPQQHPVATFFGGGSGSGKSMLKPAAPDSAKIDSDAAKELLPEYQAMLKTGDPRIAQFVHEESSDIAKQAVAEAQRRRVNFILDGTGDSSYAKMAAKVKAAQAAGYKVAGHYVTTDVQVALDRAIKRAQDTGRVVPEPVIREIHASVSRVYTQAAAEGLFDSTELWDNNGDHSPFMVAHSDAAGKFVVDNQAALDKFTAKGTA